MKGFISQNVDCTYCIFSTTRRTKHDMPVEIPDNIDKLYSVQYWWNRSPVEFLEIEFYSDRAEAERIAAEKNKHIDTHWYIYVAERVFISKF